MAVAAAVLRLSPASTVVGDAFAVAACAVTGCSDVGISIIGWFLTLTPVAFGLVLRLRFGRSTRTGKRSTRTGKKVLILSCAALFFVAVQFLPDPRDRMSGAGADVLADGMLWGFGTLVVAVAVLLIGLLINMMIRGSGLVPAMGVTVTLVCGLIFTGVDHTAPADLLLTTRIFPETTMRVQGDVLTRVSAVDLAGCAEEYVDCARTAEFDYTTTDSDAVTRLRIISFPDGDRARDAWGTWDTAPRTDGREAVRVADVTGEFLLVSTVRHADGRAIQPAEEPWLRWPALQLAYAFRDAIGADPARPPVASATAAPRTP